MDYVLYEMSYANMALYSAVLPSYRKPKDKDGKKRGRRKAVKVDDPGNREKLRKIFERFD